LRLSVISKPSQVVDVSKGMQMRIRTALASVGIASMAVVGMTTQAHAGTWSLIGVYAKKTDCVDAGTEYQREGFPYKCLYAYWPDNGYYYWLYIYN
jgi:hypothetical protein